VNIVYQIEFLSDWQCGSGLTSGADIDSMQVKDSMGFPYVPGKTIKGLLREAAETLYDFAEEGSKASWETFIKACFGNQSDKTSDQSENGVCHFSNAELTEHLKQQLSADNAQEKINALFRTIFSTAIDQDGQALEHSLRTIEVTVPLHLFGQIQGCPKEMLSKMQDCLRFVKRLGSDRNRGLGRCRLIVKEAI